MSSDQIPTPTVEAALEAGGAARQISPTQTQPLPTATALPTEARTTDHIEVQPPPAPVEPSSSFVRIPHSPIIGAASLTIGLLLLIAAIIDDPAATAARMSSGTQREILPGLRRPAVNAAARGTPAPGLHSLRPHPLLRPQSGRRHLHYSGGQAAADPAQDRPDGRFLGHARRIHGLRRDPEAAACREVLEETGLEVRIDRLLEIFHTPDDGGLADIVITYAASITGGSLAGPRRCPGGRLVRQK